MAHEIGHYLGLAHAPCGTPGDPNYPAYEPHDPASSPNASIGEYGLNINNGNVLRPQTFKDYMSYCGPGWISLYHHGRLINNSLLDPTTVHDVFPPWLDNYVLMDPNLIPEKWLPNPPPDDPLPWRRVKVNPEPLISLIGVVHSQEEVEVQSVARIQAFRDLPGAQTTEFSAELIDEQGNRLVEAPLQRLPSRAHGGCDCGHGEGGAQRPPYLFQAFLPNVAAGTALRIRRSDDEIWIRHAPAAPPRIQRFEASSVIESRALIVEWNIEASSNEEPEAWLQWSSDEGETWHGLAIDLRGQRAELDLSALPSGTVSLRLLAHDGFFTVTSDPVSVEIPTLPPSVAILNPRDGSRMEVGSSLRLWGVVTRSSGEPVEPESARWLIDGEEVARGLDVFIAAPDEGQHRCTLIVETYGETAEANVEFETVALPYESRQGESEQLGSQEEA